jgi:hypothetical protein
MKRIRSKHNKFRAHVVSIVSIVVLTYILWNYFSTPKEFVTNETFVKQSGLLFDYEITKYPSNVEIILPQEQKLTIGFVVDPWNLNFGIIPTGGSYGTRHVIITNYEENKAKIELKAYGTIRPLVSFSKNNFVLGSKESATVDVFLNTTNSTQPGNYTGEIDIVTKKPKHPFLEWFLW